MLFYITGKTNPTIKEMFILVNKCSKYRKKV